MDLQKTNRAHKNNYKIMKTLQFSCPKHGKNNSDKRCVFPTYMRVKGKFTNIGNFCIVCNYVYLSKKC